MGSALSVVRQGVRDERPDDPRMRADEIQNRPAICFEPLMLRRLKRGVDAVKHKPTGVAYVECEKSFRFIRGKPQARCR